MVHNFDDMIKTVTKAAKKTIAVAMAQDVDALAALGNAVDLGLADAILVGTQNEIMVKAHAANVDLNKFQIMHVEGELAATARAVQLVRDGQANTLMKGNCSTATILKAVLDKDHGLRSGKLLSHLGVFEVNSYPKLILMSDAAMNIYPDLTAKIAITENAIEAAQKLGIELPKVALITAIEKVNPGAMPCTVDAAVIAQMGQRGQIKGAVIDGPLAVDNALDKHSCEVKSIHSDVGGNADILIMPNIEAGNVFYKVMTYMAKSRTAGVICGASAPIILPSRADSDDSKFLAIVLALLLS